MPNTLKPVLVGDPDPARFEWLKSHLDRHYVVRCVQAKTFGEVRHLLNQSNRSRERAFKDADMRGEDEEPTNDWSLIFIADNLPPAPGEMATRERVKTYFTTLQDLNLWGDYVTVLIRTRNVKIDWAGIIPPSLVVTCTPAVPEGSYSINPELDGVGGLERVSNAESLLTWDGDDRVLLEQVRSLSEWRGLADGREQLAELISKCIDCSQVERIEIGSLGQGKSGARVFRLAVDTKPAAGQESKRQEFVLKLCPAGSVWKLESEVYKHTQAGESLGHPGYRAHLPTLRKAHRPSGDSEHAGKLKGPNEYIVGSGRWYAVHYDFVGGEAFGEVLDLETILVAPASTLKLKTAHTPYAFESAEDRAVSDTRADLLQTVLQWLCESWYADSRKGHVRREVIPVWDVDNAKEQQYDVMPPYKLTGRAKGSILSFLDGPEAEMGPRFFDDWEQHREKVAQLASADPSSAARLGTLLHPRTVTLSRVHGDLNANNVLLWLKHRHPLLIDFPFYQEAGHALQDFARLEVELKFALMDRQKDSPQERLRAFEYTYTQTQLWQEMEDRLLDQWDLRAQRWSSKGYLRNVQLCFELVQMVRRSAREVQQNGECPGPAAGDFLSEYWPALLYHTVRAVGYPSLSLFKRLLAVYSAGLILTKLGCFTNPTRDASQRASAYEGRAVLPKV
jgi:hypothetical protein